MKLASQSGIAVAPILFVIALLAILAVAIAAGSGSFTGGVSNEQDSADAQALITYAEQLRDAVTIVMANGCLDTQINFYNALDYNPANPNAPADHSCDIYDPAGGGVLYKNFSGLPVVSPVSIYPASAGQFTTSANNVVAGFGSNATLVFAIAGLTQDACTALDQIVGYNPPTFAPMAITGYLESSGFNGTYASPSTPVDLMMSSTHQGCLKGGTSRNPIYFYTGVLLGR